MFGMSSLLEHKMVPRVVVVGAGYWGKNLVRNFAGLGALGGVCESNPDTMSAIIGSYQNCRGYKSLNEVLSDSYVDGVAISTPAVSHAHLVRECLEAGKDVYVEKPLCLSEGEGAELNELADLHGRILMVGHLLWYHPVVLKLKMMIDGGELGRIQYVYSNRLNIGKLRREENVLWSFAPHDVSVIIGLVNEMPNLVRAQGGNFLHENIADTTVTLLNFASGIRAHIFVSWLHPFKEQKLVVVGDRKMAVFDDTLSWPEKLKVFPHSISWNENVPVASKADAELVEVEKDEPLRAECAHFLECIKNRHTPRTDGREGVRVLKVLNACQVSLENGQDITISSAKVESDYFVHESAYLDEGAIIGSGSKVWHFSHIHSGCIIGNNCNIGQNVVVSPNVAIGDNCKIQNNVSIYTGVTLEDDVFCGPSMVFTNVVNPRSEVSRKHEFIRTYIRKGATLGANCTIVCGNTVGRYACVGAGAVVVDDVPDFAVVVGNPARKIGWMSRNGQKLELPLLGNGEAICAKTGEVYLLAAGKVTLQETI